MLYFGNVNIFTNNNNNAAVFCDATTRLVIKSSTIMEVIIATFLDRVKLFNSTTVEYAINKRL